MTVLTKTKSIECDDLGDKIKLGVSPYYLKVIVGRKIYYFEKETGKFDGTSFDMTEN